MKAQNMQKKILNIVGYESSVVEIGPEFKGLEFTPATTKVNKLIIFIHGAGNHAYYPFFAIIPKLARDDTRLVFIDLPGHGDNVETPFSSTNVTRYMEGLSQWLKNSNNTDSEITIIAHSIGSVSFFKNHSLFSDIKLKMISISPPKRRNEKGSIFSILKIILFESLSFFLPNIWLSFLRWRLQLVPAVGNFKRKYYPINPAKPSIFYRSCESYINETDVLGRLAEFKSSHLIISANLDYIARPFSDEEIEIIGRNHRQVIYDHENHFSILFNKKCHKQIEDFIFQD